MNNQSKHFLHGGDLDSISNAYGISRSEIIDFSGNINPLGISTLAKEEIAKNLDLISTYPDRNYNSLCRGISNYVGVDSEHIIVGNGSTELISLMIQMKKPKELLIIGPTYSEYEREASLARSHVQYFRLKEDRDFNIDVQDLISQLTTDIDMLIICNPNNPTSTCIRTPELKIILDQCKENNIFVMIDETYVEFVENIESVTATSLIPDYDNLLILRGISKFFSAPGLRLGYGMSSNIDLLSHMNSHKNPWTINILASFGTEVMLQDLAYINQTKNLFNEQRNFIYKELLSFKNIKVYKPEANFVLFKLLDPSIKGHDIFDKMLQQKMLLRDASSFPFLNERFLRFCFLLPDQNKTLLEALKMELND
ncbi:MAG TPA: aminotransferase class I/II-fold pyridoxal phosphate-dependent enzyme [Epulopiscium sp.]|nr:aminotransferase class I/II-fold pyridoxal phosphate-dependent enzyme [Candidatus Epulonipiscium sp.]